MLTERDLPIRALFLILNHSTKLIRKADQQTESCYKPPWNGASFHKSALLVQDTSWHFKTLSQLCEIAVCMCKAVHSHIRGEAAFFDEEYAAAESLYLLARKHSLTAHALTTRIQLEVSQNAKARHEKKCTDNLITTLVIIKAYAAFFDIEALEAKAFKFRKNGKLAGVHRAKRLHKREIEKTEVALNRLGRVRHPLHKKLKGHAWFAKSNYCTCLSELAARAGNRILAERYACAARRAEKRSVIYNPQWRNW